MKNSKANKSNLVKEPEVEYIKQKNTYRTGGKPHKHSSSKNAPKKKIVESEPKLLTDDDPFVLGELFGLWKNRKISLEKIREKQWGKRR